MWSVPLGQDRRLSLPALLVAGLVLLPGCQSTMQHSPSTQQAPVGNAELMEYISEQPLLTADSAYRGIHILWKGEAYPGDYEALTKDLIAAHIVDRTWGYEYNAFVRKGVVGYMACKATGITTGLNWLLTDLGRYAWRELQYKGIAGPGNELGYLSGGEFLGILSRADAYVYGKRKDLEKPTLGPKPGAEK